MLKTRNTLYDFTLNNYCVFGDEDSERKGGGGVGGGGVEWLNPISQQAMF